MVRDPTVAALDGGVSEAIVAMGLPMVESRGGLFGDLATCGTPVEASEAITRRMGHRLAELGADQERFPHAWKPLWAFFASIVTHTADSSRV